MGTDWQAWFQQYDDPASSLSRRLEVVRGQVERIMLEHPAAPLLVLSLCAGDGRDLLPVLATHRPDARAVLVELDPDLSARARDAARDLGLSGVDVRTADAGDPASYDDLGPADLLLACGVFGNVADGDVERSADRLPAYLAAGGRVVWTRGRRVDPDPSAREGDVAQWVRDAFGSRGYVEEAFVAPDDASFRVGVHRWPGGEGSSVLPSSERLFTFVR